MSLYGLLIDYNYCSGCRTCEIACQQEHGYDMLRQGLTLATIGPFPLPNERWQFDNLPLHTPYCNHCASRIAKGKKPACVHHCQAGCIEFGEVSELVTRLDGGKKVLYTL